MFSSRSLTQLGSGIIKSAVLALSLATVSTGASAAVIVLTDAGITHNTTGLTGFSTDGADMAGMSVTAFFSGGGSETIAWAATSSIAGAANGSGWSLTESGDTFGGTWTLTNLSGPGIIGLLLNGTPGNTLFDIPAAGDSVGSGGGIAFTLTGVAPAFDITATYRNIVSINGALPQGDLWTTLDLSFSSSMNAASTFSFRQDTDSAATAGDITPVPAPGSLALVGLGLLMLGRRGSRQS